MGGGSSAFSRDEKKTNIRVRNDQVRTVEKFMLCAYSCCSRVEAMWLILASTSGLRQFTNFVESERSSEYLILFLETNKIKSVKNPTMYVLCKYIEGIIQDYLEEKSKNRIIISENLKKDLTLALTCDTENGIDPVERILTSINDLRTEMVVLMAREQFTRFLSSRFYKNWRANERGRAVASTSENAESSVRNYNNVRKNSKTTDPGENARTQKEDVSVRNMRSTTTNTVSNVMHSHHTHDPHSLKARPSINNTAAAPPTTTIRNSKRIIPVDVTVRAFANVESQELGSILDQQSWLSILLAAVEVLPICFQLIKVSKNQQKFPIIYVNKFFEKFSGLKRNQVIGHSGRDFHYNAQTEKDQIVALSPNLGESTQVVSAILTNIISATGNKVHSLITMKPIFDHNGVFIYVICIQIDITREMCFDKQNAAVLAARIVINSNSRNDSDEEEEEEYNNERRRHSRERVRHNRSNKNSRRNVTSVGSGEDVSNKSSNVDAANATSSNSSSNETSNKSNRITNNNSNNNNDNDNNNCNNNNVISSSGSSNKNNQTSSNSTGDLINNATSSTDDDDGGGGGNNTNNGYCYQSCVRNTANLAKQLLSILPSNIIPEMNEVQLQSWWEVLLNSQYCGFITGSLTSSSSSSGNNNNSHGSNNNDNNNISMSNRQRLLSSPINNSSNRKSIHNNSNNITHTRSGRSNSVNRNGAAGGQVVKVVNIREAERIAQLKQNHIRLINNNNNKMKSGGSSMINRMLGI